MKYLKYYFVALIVGLYTYDYINANSNKQKRIDKISNEILDRAKNPIDKQFVCQSAMAAIFGHFPYNMQANKIANKYRISWRANDGSKWGANCWLLGNSRVMWQSIRKDGSEGRIRDSSGDEKITFVYTSNIIHIIQTFPNNSKIKKHFKINPN